MEWLKQLLSDALKNAVEEGKIEDTITKIIDKAKKEIPKHFVAKDDFDEKNTALKDTKTKMDALQKEIDVLSKSTGTIEEIQAKLKDKELEFESFKVEAETREANRKKKIAIEKGLIAAKASTDAIDLLTEKFELDKIILDSKGNIVDWDNHLNGIRDSRKGLFGVVQVDGTPPAQNSAPGAATGDWAVKLAEARKTGRNLEAIKIKQEAAAEGVYLP